MNHLGMAEENLFVAIADNASFYERLWHPFQLYAYKASLYGFGHNGSPSYSLAGHIVTFSLVINERQLICTTFLRFKCNFANSSRELEKLYFRSQGGESSNYSVVMLGQ